MKVLIIGGGGREHALAWKAAQSQRVERVFVAPGNAGTALEAKVENISISPDHISALVEFAKDQDIGLTIVGPEAPLVAGVVDAFDDAGLRCFGPTRAAARLEASKAFTKAFLQRHGIPSGTFATFTDADAAEAHIRRQGAPVVVKADGLAAGKGVAVAFDVDEAVQSARDMLCGKAFGDAGRRIVVEEYLQGEEASFIALVDGETILPMASSQDHKARDDGDLGPNTGGMGAYSPAPVVTDAMHRRIMEEVMMPTVQGMAADGCPYKGFLYAGVMIDPQGTPKVLEFNCRFGDPEAQPILMRLTSDLVALCDAAVDGKLAGEPVAWDKRAALGVVMACAGYPSGYAQGAAITGLESDLPGTKVFHAGTSMAEGRTVTAGGRVLCVCALGNTVSDAQALAYERVARIGWENAYFRSDIGYRALGRE